MTHRSRVVTLSGRRRVLRYFRVTLPLSAGHAAADSFAWMYSVEEPVLRGARCGVGAQVMGPGDSYLVQHGRSVSSFWGEPHALALGHTFCRAAGGGAGGTPAGPLPEPLFDAAVAEGFQASAVWHQGRLRADGATAGAGPSSSVGSASWSFRVEPAAGWGGGPAAVQRSTAGWLAALPVFEPHWQVLMSHGKASGWVQWGDRRYEFDGAPFYSEKNWGGAFPRKWFWAQCNAFDGAPGLALTAGGGVRALPALGSDRTEDVALIGLHVPSAMLPDWAVRAAGGDADYTFIEAVPWAGQVEWRVSPWGFWQMRASTAHFDVALRATCSRTDGVDLRAPTADRGLAAVCRDTFAGELTLCVWPRGRSGDGAAPPLLRVSSRQAALEVGGGPWPAEWEARAGMAPPLAAALRLPVDVAAVAGAMGRPPPPGL
jgi:tocopherol cyclase